MIEIPLTNRDFPALVSDCDADIVTGQNWFAKKSRHGWYVCCSIRIGKQVKTVRLHRLIMKCPDDMTVDHLDGNHWDNRRENLEVVSGEENNARQHRYNEEDIAERMYG